MKPLAKLLAAGILIYPVLLFAQNPGEEEPISEGQRAGDSGPIQFSFKNRPSLRLGDYAQIDFKTKWHFDFRGFDPPRVNPPGVVTALPVTPDTFLLTMARMGFKGNVTNYIEFEVERDMRRTFSNNHEYHPWKDNYVNVKVIPFVHIKAGKFKIPFGLEENLSEDRLDFALDSRVSNTLAPSRDVGVMLHSKILESARLEYQAGVRPNFG